METIWGRRSLDLDLTGLNERLANYNRITLDLGTGDGKFAFYHARTFPTHFVIGVDACRENLREHSRVNMPNLLFIIANAQRLPHELDGLISHITINFPWGSLLESLLNADPDLMRGLESVARVNATIDIHLNGGALAEAGATFEAGALTIFDNLQNAGWHMKSPMTLDSSALRQFPSTWAKRLTYGRDPRVVQLSGYL